MTDRPILFSSPMVRAIIAGEKTQTRRVMKPQPYSNGFGFSQGSYEITCHNDYLPPSVMLWDVKRNGRRIYTTSNAEGWETDCPYGVPGDRLWVRETWARDGSGGYRYYATDDVHELRRKMPSIHMPRVASRLTLQITGVRVQRLKSITEDDAKAEGADRLVMDDEHKFYQDTVNGTHRCGFAGLWNHINGDRHGADWDSDPYVWAISFSVMHGNIDTLPSSYDQSPTDPHHGGKVSA